MTYKNMIIVIKNNITKTKEELLNICDVFLMNNRINDVEYNDLVARINEKYPEPVA